MTQKQINEEKAMNNCEMYQGYVSIYELIDMLNEKYKFLDNDSIFDSYFFAENDHDEKLIDELTAKIITAIQKSKNYVDYLDPQDNDTMTYLIDVHSIRNVEVALHYYLEAKSSIMNPQALKERDNKLQSDQITKIAKDQVDKKRILVQIRTSGEYLDDQQFEKVENAFANWELLFGNSHDLISKIKMISSDLLNYGQIDDDFENRLVRDMERVKLEVAYQNTLTDEPDQFDQVQYISDYFMRELHTVKIRGKQIVYEGYSKYDLKLQNPLEWYCYKR